METTYSASSTSSSFTITKVFGWMFLAILLTAITAFGLPYLLIALDAVHLYMPILIGGAIATIILTFVTHIVLARSQSKPLAITLFCLFAVAMGTWVSSITIMYSLSTIAYALFITSAIFGVMSVYGAVTKRSLEGFGSFLFMLLLGSIFLLIVNLILRSSALDWFLSYLILGIYIGFIAYDMQRIKKMAESGKFGLNAALLMALNLYVDFVYIFIRVVALVGRNQN